MTRIAIYGGTFDPIHMGHLEVAKAVIEEKAADRLYFMPNYISPFKQGEIHSSGEDRINMINIAIRGLPNIEASDYEIKRKSPSYTIDTLEAFERKFSHDICFVAGADSIDSMEEWHRGPELLSKFKIIAVKRVGFPIEKLIKKIAYYKKKYNSEIFLLNKIPKHISSSAIRDNLIFKDDVSEYLTAEVIDYILKNDLYKNNPNKCNLEKIKKFNEPNKINKIRRKYNNYLIDENLKYKLEKLLTKKRYIHSLGVANMAKRLARIYGIDEEKAYFSGYIHDMAKCLSVEESNRYVRYYGIDYKYINNIQIAHSKVGAKLAEDELGIKDMDIINAISYHTTARADMSLLEEILYVSDAIEINRKYNEVERLRKEAEIDLDKVCLFILDFCIEDLNKKNKEIDRDTIHAREWILKKIKRRNNE